MRQILVYDTRVELWIILDPKNCVSSSFADNVQFVLLRMGKAGMF